MNRRLVEGSEAIAEAMVAAGCRFFAGYPMTPFTEVLEHMARLLPGAGGTCVNAESELEAIGMVWGAAATGARAATGSVGQGLSLMQESLAELCHAQIPVVVLNMARGQGDYYQATRGGGHGDYRHPVFAPSDVGEAIRLVQLAFHTADRWRNPTLVLGDFYLAHVQEAVAVELLDFGPLPAKDWSLDGTSSGTRSAKILSPVHSYSPDPGPTDGRSPDGERLQVDYGTHLASIVDRIAAMSAGIEPLSEVGFTEEAVVVAVAYGTAGRYLRCAVANLRDEGLPIGYFRPITLWPFPSKQLVEATRNAHSVAVLELNAGQMIDDVRLALGGHTVIEPIGGVAFDESGFGISPLLDVETIEQRLRLALDRCRTRSQ